jgi:hypothetical protein
LRPLTVIALGIVAVCSGCATSVTGSPVRISPTDAIVAGRVISDTGGPVETWAQYGPTKAYGSETAHDIGTAEPNEPTHVSSLIEGLAPATTYHYRVCASDSQQQGGPGCGEDHLLTTQTVGCGSVVTTSVKLTGNLICPQVVGLIVGADGVEINLAGYTFDGEINFGSAGPRGIDNSGGYDDLTVRNGNVTGWGDAVYVDGGQRNRVVNVRAFGSSSGVTMRHADAGEVRSSEVEGRSAGISMVSSDSVIVANTEANAAFNAAISVRGNLATVSGNRIVRSGAPLGSDPAIGLVGSSGRIARNHVEGPWLGGGITVSGSNDVIADNEVFGAVLSGFPNPQASWGDGIFVSAFASGTRVVRNSVHSNEGDGIETQDASSSVGSNAANGNGDFGIDAAAGVTDLGNNSAFGNGNPAQCRNVFC